VTEFEVQLYAPEEQRALCFARVESPAQAQSLARRWRAARPGHRVEVVTATQPLPFVAA
jgi:hypothetical protein